MRDVTAYKAWHFCLGNASGNRFDKSCAADARAFSLYCDVDVDEFVRDFACREMAEVSMLSDIPEHFRLGIGVSTSAPSRSSNPSRLRRASGRSWSASS